MQQLIIIVETRTDLPLSFKLQPQDAVRVKCPSYIIEKVPNFSQCKKLPAEFAVLDQSEFSRSSMAVPINMLLIVNIPCSFYIVGFRIVSSIKTNFGDSINFDFGLHSNICFAITPLPFDLLILDSVMPIFRRADFNEMTETVVKFAIK